MTIVLLLKSALLIDGKTPQPPYTIANLKCDHFFDFPVLLVVTLPWPVCILLDAELSKEGQEAGHSLRSTLQLEKWVSDSNL